jgi:DNA-binding NtrC family response regulator
VSETGTLILREVGRLTPESRRRLMAWPDDARSRTQVIAINTDALWPQVKDGAFPEALYYRLNVIYIDLSNGSHNSGGKP